MRTRQSCATTLGCDAGSHVLSAMTDKQRREERGLPSGGVPPAAISAALSASFFAFSFSFFFCPLVSFCGRAERSGW